MGGDGIAPAEHLSVREPDHAERTIKLGIGVLASQEERSVPRAVRMRGFQRDTLPIQPPYHLHSREFAFGNEPQASSIQCIATTRLR